VLGLVVTVPASEAELAADSLWTLGVTAVEERGATDTGEGVVELWTSLGDDPNAVAQAAEGFPARWRWRIVELDASVMDAWRDHAKASWVESDLVIVPAWLRFEPPSGTTVVRIEPGATFGLGDHPTTVLALRALRSALAPGAAVLDVGCGSGVLGVAACVLGAGSARGIDVSPAAPSVAMANAVANGVGDRVVVDTKPLADVRGTFDVVVANILAPPLIALADDLVRVTAPDGALVVSGVLEARHEHVTAALAPMRPLERRTREGWIAVTLRH
jgi:ribosomal protein L11 methyltransferase